jgi:hypothetical protein
MHPDSPESVLHIDTARILYRMHLAQAVRKNDYIIYQGIIWNKCSKFHI